MTPPVVCPTGDCYTKPKVRSEKVVSFEAEFATAKDLLIGEDRPDLALPIFSKLYCSNPNNIDLLVYYAAALIANDRDSEALEIIAQINQWAKTNNGTPKMVIISIFATAKFGKPDEALEQAMKIIDNPQFLNTFTPKELKQFYNLVGELIVSNRFASEEVTLTYLAKAREYLKESLDIPSINPDENYTDYRSHMLLAEIYMRFGRQDIGLEEKFLNFNMALAELEKALSSRPSSLRPCQAWESIKALMSILPSPPDACKAPRPPITEIQTVIDFSFEPGRAAIDQQ
jgi:tetratricopeptide (TPR) repeat protein